MKWWVFLTVLTFLALLWPRTVHARCTDKPDIVAVIDTGFGFQGRGKEARLCKMGHKDFTLQREFYTAQNVKSPIPLDTHGHGTNIVGIIERNAKHGNANYCILILKYYNQNGTGYNNLNATIEAINYATNLKVDYINYSGGGEDPDVRELEAIEKFLNQGGHFVAAAGNESKDLDLPGNGYYPAKYDKRIVVVGNLRVNGKPAFSSNYGKVVNRWERGTDVEGYGITMSGTSQATANATGKIVSQTKNKCDIGK